MIDPTLWSEYSRSIYSASSTIIISF